MNSNLLKISNFKYTVRVASPIEPPKIYDGNPFNLSQISQITIMGLTSTNKNPYFKTNLKYHNPEFNKTLELDYVSEYRVNQKLELESFPSESLISLMTELHFRHHIHIHQFLDEHNNQDKKGFPFPPYLQNLSYSFQFVSEQIQQRESRNN